MLRLALATLALCLALPRLSAQSPSAPLPGGGDAPALPPLVGEVRGDMYYAPSGAYKITIPVLPELGGSVTDTSNVVTFQDPFSTHISIACFPMDTFQKWDMETKGTKDYLKTFFIQYVLRDFQRGNAQTQVETNARYIPGEFGGTFVTYVTLPGGSMFADPALRIDPASTPPVAKRGNMLFTHDGFIYVISTELAERVTEGSAYHKTNDEEDVLLRDRLLDIANRIRFLKAPAAPSS